MYCIEDGKKVFFLCIAGTIHTANVLTIKTTGTGNCGVPAGKICTIYGIAGKPCDNYRTYNYHGVSPQFLQPFSIDSADFPCRDPAISSPRSFYGQNICSAERKIPKGSLTILKKCKNMNTQLTFWPSTYNYLNQSQNCSENSAAYLFVINWNSHRRVNISPTSHHLELLE